EREDDREQEKVVRMREHPEAGREPDRRDQHDVARAVAVEEVAEQRSEEGSDDIDAGENQGQLGARDVESDDLLARENPRRVQIDTGGYENEETAQRYQGRLVTRARFALVRA